jgi:hypothetical protein
MYEPLDIIAKDDPMSCSEYAKRNSLLDTPGRKRCPCLEMIDFVP